MYECHQICLKTITGGQLWLLARSISPVSHNIPTGIRWHMQPPYVVQGTAYPLHALFDVSIPFESIATNRQC